ncbi:MAG: SpoIIE family protein phosphatase [Acidobacteria bacterium]|nr:SpoIIE family protein phosphatase [Acidobacteriota bacterium]
MSEGAHLEVVDALGRRVVAIDKDVFGIGRRSGNDLRLVGSDVSRDHAEIIKQGERYAIRDKGSRYGTFVNGDQIAGDVALKHGDQIRFGRSGGAELQFLTSEAPPLSTSSRATSSAVGDLRQIAALLEGLRALGSGRVLDDVLALVLDSAIEVTGAERGFVMLANAKNVLEFKMARGRGRVTLSGRTFETSRKIPEEVFARGEARLVADLLDGDLANVHMGTVALGIRHVLCTPLRLLRYIERGDVPEEDQRIGVLYLDSREKGVLLTKSTQSALETLATEAAVAIQNARLYREALEKAKLEQELRIAAEIQQALMPESHRAGRFFEAAGSTIPSRSIGGDFFEYADGAGGEFGFALGDVAGKGAPAALLSAVLQGMFATQTSFGQGPAATLQRMNAVLLRRGIESRFATMFYGMLSADGRLVCCNAGHNPPIVIGRHGVRRLETGGLILGLFEHALYEEESLQLDPGDLVIVFSDGVSEARSASDEEFGEERLLEVLEAARGADPPAILERLLHRIREFAEGAVQSDDITIMVVRYAG